MSQSTNLWKKKMTMELNNIYIIGKTHSVSQYLFSLTLMQMVISTNEIDAQDILTLMVEN